MRRKALFGSATVLFAVLALPLGCNDTRRNPDVCHSEPCEEGFVCSAQKQCVRPDAGAEGGRPDGSAADAADGAADGDATSDADGAASSDAGDDVFLDAANIDATVDAATTADAAIDVSSSADGATD
jgi:hypothetical protein